MSAIGCCKKSVLGLQSVASAASVSIKKWWPDGLHDECRSVYSRRRPHTPGHEHKPVCEKTKCNILQFSQQSNFSDVKRESEIERVTNKQRLEGNGSTGLVLVIPLNEKANVCNSIPKLSTEENTDCVVPMTKETIIDLRKCESMFMVWFNCCCNHTGQWRRSGLFLTSEKKHYYFNFLSCLVDISGIAAYSSAIEPQHLPVWRNA